MSPMSPKSAARRTAAIAVLLGVLVVVAAVTIASGASTPSTPTILTKPVSPTNNPVATFTFSAPPAGVSNQCKLDAGAFGACTTATSYTTGVLAPNLSHTFQVRAKNNVGNKTSSAASYTWVVDTLLPGAPSITSGPAPSPAWTTTTTSSFAFAGEAGATFLCRVDGLSFAACVSGVSYTVSQGPHTFDVKQRDAALNLGTAVTSRTWKVDSIAPSVPSLTVFPDDPNGNGIADFEWTMSSEEPSVTYACQLENLAFTPCDAFHEIDGVVYHDFHDIVLVNNNQQHQFVVRATDLAGNTSQKQYVWKVDQALQFTITGNAVGSLYPRHLAADPLPLDLTIHNPNHFDIKVTSLEVTIQSVAKAFGAPVGPCTADDFKVVQYVGPDFIVPRGDHTLSSRVGVSLSDLPTIGMYNTTANQDGCKRATVHLEYLGTAVKP